MTLTHVGIFGGRPTHRWEPAPIVPVSTKSGAGLDALKSTLIELTEGLPTRSAEGRFRLPAESVRDTMAAAAGLEEALTAEMLAHDLERGLGPPAGRNQNNGRGQNTSSRRSHAGSPASRSSSS